MKSTVLVPVEAATWTDVFVAELTRLLDAATNKIVLLHVVPDLTEVHPGDARQLLIDARSLLARCAAQLELPGARVQTSIQMGNPRSVIPQQAILMQAGLIAMATYGRAGIEDGTAGGIVEHVMRICHCPTLLVQLTSPTRRKVEPGRRVLIPADGSVNTGEVTETLCELLRPANTEVIIYHDHSIVGAMDDNEAETQWQALLGAQRQRLLSAGFRVSMVTPERSGQPIDLAERIRELNVDMVAMITHARAGLSRLMLGTLTEAVLYHSTCPLLAIARSPRHDLSYREEYRG